MVKRTQLAGGPDKTVTWIWLENGYLKAEYYDFSESTQQFFGNDIAYTITIHQMDKLYLTSHQNENSILPWMAQNFKGYFDIKKWLEENEIGFDIKIESWA